MPIKLRLHDVELFGSGLERPEGVMVAQDGTVWAACRGRGCTRITPDGKCETIGNLDGVPNGICIDTDGSIVVANIGTGGVQRLFADGRHETIATEADGRRLTTPNFPFIDSTGRLWVTNSTARTDYKEALREPGPDGFLCVIVDGVARVVADGLRFANGIALDEREEHVYVAETYGLRVVRYPIHDDGTLGPVEQYGPPFGEQGYPDGIAFDAAQNLWVTLPAMNALGVIDSSGDWQIVLEDLEGDKLRRPTNICFGGDDLRTAYVGSLRGTSLPRFRVDVPGMPLVHQGEPT